MAVDRVREVVEDEWAYLVGLLPANLDELAEESGALQRRRAVGSAQDLLRLALAYAAHDWSLRQTAAMAEVMGWQSISDVGVLKRLRGCPEFLRRVISGVLARRIEIFPRSTLRVCLVDATTVSRPGSAGVDWRLHVVYDLFALQLREVQVTDALGGESLRRFPVRPEEVYVGDRLYGTTPGILHVLTHDGTLIVRVSLLQVRLVTPRGGSLDLLSWLEELPDAQAAECPVAIQGDKPESIRWPLRLIAVRKSPEAASRAAEQAVQSSRKKGHAVMEETLILARYMVLLTNCEAGVTPEQALEAYRFRWQIELAFKRLKSLLHLDQLRAKDPDLAQTYLLAKILGALLVEELVVRAGDFSPWGFRLVPTPTEPLASPSLLG